MKKNYLLIVVSLLVIFLNACEKTESYLKIDSVQIDAVIEGGIYEINVSSNQDWKATWNTESGISVTPSVGYGSAKVTIVVPAAKSIDETITNIEFAPMKSSSVVPVIVKVSQKAIIPQLSVVPSVTSIEYIESNFDIDVTSNIEWKATSAIENVIITPSTGNGNTKVKVTVPEYLGDKKRDIEIMFTPVIDKISSYRAVAKISQSEPILKIGDIEYKIKKMADGRWWMNENLRNIPTNKVPSDDPTVESGIWYPSVNGVVANTPEDVLKMGYLYDTRTIFNVDAITEENADSFEGAQGLCPDGWHIPTLAEAEAFIQAYYDESARGASLEKMEKDGVNTLLGGFRMKNVVTQTPKYSTLPGYIITSTKNMFNDKMTNNKAIMKTDNAVYKNMTIALSSNLGGNSVRCIKNK